MRSACAPRSAASKNGGYRLTYTDKPTTIESLEDEQRHQIDALYSLGVTISSGGDTGAEDGAVRNVLTGSPADVAGITAGTRIIAIDGRKFSSDVLHDALTAHKGGHEPLRLIVANDDRYTTVDVVVSTGERFPHLVRDPAHADELVKIYEPRTFVPTRETPESSETASFSSRKT